MVLTEKIKNSSAGLAQYFLTALTAAGTLLLIAWILKYSAYGIDFTDESFYLVWIANPFNYSGSITQFGFIYHPLYYLLDGDIAALRQANILITFGLAWTLTHTFLRSLAPELKGGGLTLNVTAAGLASSALIFFDSWLPTPSYNSLALQSLLVSAIGLTLMERTVSRNNAIGWLLIGVGGWLAFMAKPSTALALAVSVFLYLLLSHKFSIRMFALTIACTLTLLLTSALLIDGSVLHFVERLQLGVEFSKYLGGGHTLSQILRIDSFKLHKINKLSILFVFSLTFIAINGLCKKNKIWLLFGLIASTVLFTFIALLALDKIHWTAHPSSFQGLLIFGVVYAAALSSLALGHIKSLATITVSQRAIACLFLITPHIYAFGTNGNYWQAGSSAAIFWLLAGLTLLGPMIREYASWLITLPLALATLAVTATLLKTGFEKPYRQTQPLRLNGSLLEIGPDKSVLMLSKGYSEYITSAIASAQKAGFEPTTPMIDLSGQSPGILYALGAESIGQGWTIGGYPGSLKLAEAALALTACEKIAVAWVLFEQDGPRSIPAELMPNLGADFPSSYKQVGAWYTAEGAGGYAPSRRQALYRPIMPSETLKACLNLRKGAGL